MKLEEAGQILGILTAGFHRETLEQGTIDLWMDILEPMDAELATKIAMGWVKNQDRFPTISQFRHAYHGERRGLERPALSAAHAATALVEMAGNTLPTWVQRWLRRYRVVSKIREESGPEAVAKFHDWRVFPEQIAGTTRFSDDPRFTVAEAERLGLMPEDAWLEA